MPKRRAATGLPSGISRIDQDSTRTHGYFVRAGWSRRRDGSYAPKFKAFFGDASHNGKKKALAAAKSWLAKTVKQLPKKKAAKGKPRRAARPRARAASKRRTRRGK